MLEALSVIIQVASFKLTGQRVFKMAPLHHHFELVGWSEPKVITRFVIVAIIFALFSLTTLKLGERTAAWQGRWSGSSVQRQAGGGRWAADAAASAAARAAACAAGRARDADRRCEPALPEARNACGAPASASTLGRPPAGDLSPAPTSSC